MAIPEPSSPLPPADLPEIHDLATPEEVAARKRRRRLLIAGIVATGLSVFGAWGTRPGLRAIKGWQARRAVAEATRLLDAGQTGDAVRKLQDALALRGTDPEVMRAAALFLSKVGHGREAAKFWEELEKVRPLSRDEQGDYAADLLAAGDVAGADARLRLAWPEGTEGTAANWSLGMQIALRRHDANAAATLARRLVDPKTPGTTESLRLNAALVLLNIDNAETRGVGLDTLHALADGEKSPESLQALLLLARQAAQEVSTLRSRQEAVPEASVRAVLDLAGRVEAHPQAKANQQLLALQLREAAQPDQRAALIQRAVDRYGHTRDNDDLAALAAWLYAQGEFQRVLEVDPPERATASRALYLQYLDVLGAQGRWADIRSAIEGQRFTLEPVLEEMYLARCATMLKQPESADLHWKAAVKAAGSNPEKLLSLARYAQSNGALGAAEEALRAALQAAPKDRSVHEAMLGLMGMEGRTRDARETLKGMLGIWPQDAAVRNDYAYLGALLNEDLPADRDTARELVSADPGSVPHRVTLALAELRLGHGLTALDALKPIAGGALGAQAKFLAVYAAVLRETGFAAEAKAAEAAVKPEQLLPEEKTLLAGTKSTG